MIVKWEQFECLAKIKILLKITCSVDAPFSVQGGIATDIITFRFIKSRINCDVTKS